MQDFVELSFLQCSYCGILSTFYVVGICPVGFCLVGFCPVGFCPGFIHIKCDMNVLDKSISPQLVLLHQLQGHHGSGLFNIPVPDRRNQRLTESYPRFIQTLVTHECYLLEYP